MYTVHRYCTVLDSLKFNFHQGTHARTNVAGERASVVVAFPVYIFETRETQKWVWFVRLDLQVIFY